MHGCTYGPSWGRMPGLAGGYRVNPTTCAGVAQYWGCPQGAGSCTRAGKSHFGGATRLVVLGFRGLAAPPALSVQDPLFQGQDLACDTQIVA